jgi:hypothetical protein
MNPTLAIAMKAASEARKASAAARRLQMAQLRTALQMHKAQNQHHRRQVSDALVRIRGNCAALRAGVRRRLRPAGAPANNDKARPIVDPLHARVLDILGRHPRGIGAREIGNELGIDWRQVIAVMSALVGRGVVDQVDQDFYRAGKASHGC